MKRLGENVLLAGSVSDLKGRKGGFGYIGLK